jgi:hypothetical protein
MDITIIVSEPKYAPAKNLTCDDVWGKLNEDQTARIDDGMIVHREGERCGIFYDIVPFKAVTVLCDEADFFDVAYWLEFVQGAGCIKQVGHAWTEDDGTKVIGIRAEYMAW